MMPTEYRYRNEYPAGPCTLTVRGESVSQGEPSSWGEKLPEDTFELKRGWLIEETRKPAAVKASRKAPKKARGQSSEE